MVLHNLVRANNGGKSSQISKSSFKEGMILLCQSILEMRRMSHLHGSAIFTIPLMRSFSHVNKN